MEVTLGLKKGLQNSKMQASAMFFLSSFRYCHLHMKSHIVGERCCLCYLFALSNLFYNALISSIFLSEILYQISDCVLGGTETTKNR